MAEFAQLGGSRAGGSLWLWAPSITPFLCSLPTSHGVQQEVLPGIRLHRVSELVLGFQTLSGDLGFLPTSAYPSSGPLSSVKWEGCFAYLQGPSSGDMTCLVALHPLVLLRDGWLGDPEKMPFTPWSAMRHVPHMSNQMPEGLLGWTWAAFLERRTGHGGWRAGEVKGFAFRCLGPCFMFKGGIYFFLFRLYTASFTGGSEQADSKYTNLCDHSDWQKQGIAVS